MTDDDLTGAMTLSIRTLTGIWTLTRFDGRWRCSCGAVDCPHIAEAVAFLADVVANRREGYGDE